MTTENLLSTDLQVDPGVQRHLSAAAKWARFIAIIGFIFSVILAIASLFNFTGQSGEFDRDNGAIRNRGMGSGYLFFIMAGIALLWFTTSVYTFRFGAKMRTALGRVDQVSFNDSLKNLARNYRFLGIATILLILFVLVGVCFLFFASFSRF